MNKKREISEQIKEALQQQNMNWHQLYRFCHIKNYKERLFFIDALHELQLQGEIYQYSGNRFSSFPNNYQLGYIEEINHTTCLTINHKVVSETINPQNYLNGDIVVFEKDLVSNTYKIHKIIQRDIDNFETFLLRTIQKKELNYRQIKHLACAKCSADYIKLTKLLQKLEVEGKIFKNQQTYQIFPESKFSIVKLQSNTANELYYEENNHQIFLPRDLSSDFIDQDVLLIDKKSHKVQKLIQRNQNQQVFEVVMVNGIKQLKAISFQDRQNIKARIGSLDMKKLKVGDRITANVTKEANDNYYEANYLDTIGNKNEPDIDLKTIAVSKGFHLSFDSSCQKQIQTIPLEIANYELLNRYDFRNKNIFTIDCDQTKDIDDAISIEILPNGNYLLGVHIANVSHYVKPNTPLYQEAQQRSTSLYMLNTVIPMLPSILSNGICSLNPHVDRLTKSCLIEIDKEANIINFNIVDSVIRSKIKMSYSKVNDVLINNIVDQEYLPFVDDLKLMQELSDKITLKQWKNGSLHFANTDVEAVFNEQNQPIDFILNEQGTAGKLIENFMISANHCVDQYLNWLPGPTINRIHEAPEDEDIKNAICKLQLLGYKIKNSQNCEAKYKLQDILKTYMGTKDFPIVSKICLTSMPRAAYSTENHGHFGLGTPYYTHFTSPIRRFPDLRVHTLLDQYQGKSIIDFETLENELKQICEHSSYMERQADAAEKQALITKMLDYMDNHRYQFYQGIVTDINQDKIFVQTNNHIPGYINYRDMSLPLHLSSLHKVIINEEKIPILRVGHEVKLQSLGSDRSALLASFALKDNLTLSKAGNKNFQKTLRKS